MLCSLGIVLLSNFYVKTDITLAWHHALQSGVEPKPSNSARSITITSRLPTPRIHKYTKCIIWSCHIIEMILSMQFSLWFYLFLLTIFRFWKLWTTACWNIPAYLFMFERITELKSARRWRNNTYYLRGSFRRQPNRWSTYISYICY